jgi:uncharacterized protein (DUF305 family)
MPRPRATPVALAVVAVALVACGPPTTTAPTVHPQPPTATAMATGATQTSATTATMPSFDQLFIDMMVPHHEGALAMARIALERAERPEIRQLADEILRSQDAEISRMRQWRREWFGSEAIPPMNQMQMLSGMGGMTAHTGQTMDMAADVERLRTASGPFDIAFIDAMIPHHQSAIEAGRLALQQATRAEIKDLALAIIEAQQREIGQMRAWRAAWGTNAPAPAPVATPGHGGHEVSGEDMNH